MSPLNLDPKKPAKQHWKSLEELAGTPEFRAGLEREFPEGASEAGSLDRRQFLQVMGASMAFAGLTGCDAVRRPEYQILPYNSMPEHLIPGQPQFYATTLTIGEEVLGLLVESHEGRPTKIEGNPRHPASLGATGRMQQASILDLYNPERSRVPLRRAAAAEWAAFWTEMDPVIESLRRNRGAGLRIVSGRITSPSFAEVKRHVQAAFPESRWLVHEPVNRDNARAGLQGAVGRPVDAFYGLDAARRILSIDCDFLESEINHVAHARAFARTRDPDLGREGMSRLYVVEGRFSTTGANADHRLRVKPSHIPSVFAFIAGELQRQGLGLQADELDLVRSLSGGMSRLPAGVSAGWIRALCTDLLAARGQSLVMAGKYQPPAVHALAHVLNRGLGNVGKTVRYKPSATHPYNQDSPPSAAGMRELAADLQRGAVDTVIFLGVNPLYAAPAALGLEAKLAKVAHSVHLGTEVDETALACRWHLPESHFLEGWDDAMAFDGTASIAQPLIAPLYDTLSRSEVVARLFGYRHHKGHDIVRGYWEARRGGPGFDSTWKKWLHDGIVEAGSLPEIEPGTGGDLGRLAKAHAGSMRPAAEGETELLLIEDPNLLDGRFASNAWLQELPDPITKVSWDNAAYMSPALAQKLGLKDSLVREGDGGIPLGKQKMPLVTLDRGGRRLTLPAWVVPGLAADTVVVHLGYGRRAGGKVAQGSGFDAYRLLEDGVGRPVPVEISVAQGTYEIANVQDHWSMEGRPIVREGGLDTYLRKQDFAKSEYMEPHPPLKSLWEEHDYSKGMQWGMSIDLNSCTGCQACLLACQAENNIPVVGKKQVMLGREMYWIRSDRYFSGDIDDPEVAFQAMLCQHCETAPCESVCPVSATVHSREGLNEMAYNRCIGTRYCSNNCPYKVRRFNFFNFTKRYTEVEKMQKNPDVTVRFRGVMEKCTYCVQRINQARIAYKNQGVETIPDGAVAPACAQVCPSEAIVFGNINDAGSKVSRLKKHPRSYGVLEALHTRPRTSYLAKVRNRNPAIGNGGGAGAQGKGA